MQQLSLAFTPLAAAGTTGCFVPPECAIHQRFRECQRGEPWKSPERSGMYGVQHLPTHGKQRVLDSARHVGTGIFVRHDHTPCEHARTLCLGGSTSVLEGCTMALYVDAIMKVLYRWSAIKGRRFGSDEDVCAAAIMWFHQQPRKFFGDLVGWMPVLLP
jgi:hypothetical protein